jgi:hypothetical protein
MSYAATCSWARGLANRMDEKQHIVGHQCSRGPSTVKKSVAASTAKLGRMNAALSIIWPGPV